MQRHAVVVAAHDVLEGVAAPPTLLNVEGELQRVHAAVERAKGIMPSVTPAFETTSPQRSLVAGLLNAEACGKNLTPQIAWDSVEYHCSSFGRNSRCVRAATGPAM